MAFKKTVPTRWASADLDQLISLWPHNSCRQVAAQMGREPGAVKSKASALGLNKHPSYNRMEHSVMALTANEKQFIIDHHQSLSYRAIAKKLKRGVTTVGCYGKSIGLNKINKGRFCKGNVPHTKGKKQHQYMSAKAIERTKATRFKKGIVPHNTKERDGEITIRKSKGRPYQYIRLSVGKWKELHVHLWELHHGKPPKGTIVQFKDSNSLNCVIENLYLIKRKDQMKKNTIHRYPTEVKRAIRALSSFNRKLKKYEEQD